MLTPRRAGAFRGLWRAVRAGRVPGAPSLGERVAALPRLVADAVTGRYRGVGRGRLVMCVLAVAYLVSPVDVLPELFLNVFGLGDDAVVVLWLAGVFLGETERYLSWAAQPASPAG